MSVYHLSESLENILIDKKLEYSILIDSEITINEFIDICLIDYLKIDKTLLIKDDEIKLNKYVYLYLNPMRPIDPYKIFFNNKTHIIYYEPFYIGKGSSERKYDHIRRSSNISKKKIINECILNNTEPIIYTIVDSLSNNESIKIEHFLIKELSKDFKLTNKIDRLNMDNIIDMDIKIDISEDNLEVLEVKKILEVLNKSSNIEEAQVRLGLSKRTFYRRRNSYGIECINGIWKQK